MPIERAEVDAIENQGVKEFYGLHLAQRAIIRDFYTLLPDSQFEFRMVDRPERKSDSPRESLVHLIEVQKVYFDALKSGKLEFRPMGTDSKLSKAQLLAELDRVDREMFTFATSGAFSPQAQVTARWGTMSAGAVLHATREHDILHVGWNLALMDHLGMERFQSLRQYWGA